MKKDSESILAYSCIKTPLGDISYTHDGKSIFSMYLGDTNKVFTKNIKRIKNKRIFIKRPHKKLEKELKEYANGKRKIFTVKTDISYMNPFAKRVLGKLKKLTYGKLTTYGKLAKNIGSPKAARAVGNAVGANPLPIIIPCHRVIKGDGSLGGFGCGIPFKKKLLKVEMPKVKW